MRSEERTEACPACDQEADALPIPRDFEGDVRFEDEAGQASDDSNCECDKLTTSVKVYVDSLCTGLREIFEFWRDGGRPIKNVAEDEKSD